MEFISSVGAWSGFALRGETTDMNRNYEAATVSRHDWADTHETHPAVAAAIHAIADSKRDVEMIWEGPTNAELDAVTMAVEEYLICGDFAREDDGRYCWGQSCITVLA